MVEELGDRLGENDQLEDLKDRIHHKYGDIESSDDSQQSHSSLSPTKRKNISSQSKNLQYKAFKNHYRRFSDKVQDQYLYTNEEILQKLKTVNLFEIFDTDASGSLDQYELTNLFNQNAVMCTTEDISKLYNAKNPKFTLQSFQDMQNDRKKLKVFRKNLK